MRTPSILTIAVALVVVAAAVEAEEFHRQQKALARWSVVQSGDTITVTCLSEPGWKAVIDGNHGGVISHFHLPADGPNLVDNHLKPSGRINPHRGMFNVFYMTRLPGKGNAGSRTKAKGTFWSGSVRSDARLSVVSAGEHEVIVRTKGTGSGWRMLGPAKETVVEYAQTYTFRPDRIFCDGELVWVYPYGTRLMEVSLQSFFTPDTVCYPLHALPSGGKRVALSLTSSHGRSAPPSVDSPFGLQVDLRNGFRLEFRPLQLPPILATSRIYNWERPWQQEWAQKLAWSGSATTQDDGVPVHTPIRYRYEMVMSKLPAAETPPLVTITEPSRDSRHRLGETVTFAATAVDDDGRRLPDANVRWEVYHNWAMTDVKHYNGPTASHTVPTQTSDTDNRDYLAAKVIATNGAGMKGVAYTTIKIADEVSSP